jgi:hypothetical protein
VPEADGIDILKPFVLGSQANVSAVLTDMSGKVIFESRPGERHTLASIAKVYILVAFLDRLSQEDRLPSEEENLLLEDMIAWSDNDSATQLWALAGGHDGLQQFMADRRLPRIEIPENNEWGDMRASAREVGLFLRRLYQGRLLDEEYTELALGYMSDVADDQAWGVGLARREGRVDPAEVYLKNGWYPEEEGDGWIVNTAGIVAGGPCEHVVVFLTDSQPSLEDGMLFVNTATSLMLAHLQRLAAVDACRPSVIYSALREN